MTVDVAGFRARFPEFVDPPFTDEVIQVRLDDAECDFSRSKLGTGECGERIYERIIYTLAAHHLRIWDNTQKGSSTGGGAIASKSVGKVSVSYARSSSSSLQDDFYLQTIYGQEYLTLLRKYCPGLITIC